MTLGSLNSEDSESEVRSMTPAEQAELETFGNEYNGPTLSNAHAARLLILMGHASTCPCQHRSSQCLEICKSTKFLMLHVRDCPGTTATMDVCPFPWCRKVKHLLFHLVSCHEPETCMICSHKDIPKNLNELAGLNSYRLKKHRQTMIIAAKASRTNAEAGFTSKQTSATSPSGAKTIDTRKLVPVAPAPFAPALRSNEGSGIVAANNGYVASKPGDAVDATASSSHNRSSQMPDAAHVHKNQLVEVKVEDVTLPPAAAIGSASQTNFLPFFAPTATHASQANPSSRVLPGAASYSVADPVTDKTERNIAGALDDENDVIPTPHSAKKFEMEEDDEDEQIEVSDLVALNTDHLHAGSVVSPTGLNEYSGVVLSEATASNASPSETSPGRSMTGTPPNSSTFHTVTKNDRVAAIPSVPTTSPSSTLCSSTTTTSESNASPATTTAEVEKTAGPVEVS
jgi:hypothetical protein